MFNPRTRISIDKNSFKPSSSHQLYQRAMTAFQGEQYLTASFLLTEAIDLNPNNIQFYDCRAATYEKLEKLSDALNDAKTMIKLSPNSAMGYLRAGNLYKILNQKEAVKENYLLGISKVDQDDPSYQKLCEFSNEYLNLAVKRTTYDITIILPHEINLEIFGSFTFANICRLTAVSKRWREYIISMKRLWQDLDFRVNSNVKITDKLVKLYVQRVQREKITIRRIFFGESPKLTDCSLKVLRKTMCHQLTSLELMSNTLISDTEICVFIHTTGLNLKHLNLSDTNIGNRTVRKILTTCSKLETLDLSSCNGVTTEAFDPNDLQCKATGIASINLSGCETVEYSVINYLVGLFPKIIQLDLKCNSVITPEVFSKLTNYPELKRVALFEHINNSAASFGKEFNSFTTTCVNLHEFTLINCSEMSDYCIECLVKSCKNLEILDLSDCKRLTNQALNVISIYSENLKILRFGCSIGIDDDGVTFLCKSRLSKKLEEIDFHGNSNITDKSLRIMGNFFVNLRLINLKSCCNITGSGVGFFVQKCQRSLKELVLNGCNNVPPDAIDLSRKLLSLNGGKVFYEFRER
nr:4942_t:CDS:2 [Entrophospora candida]